MTDLTGTLTVVTGGGQGVGFALAAEAARLGSRVVIGSLTDAAPAVEKLRSEGHEADWFQVDVSDPDEVDAFATFVQEKHGPANVVINNAAGGGAQGSLFESEVDALRRTLEVNVLGYVWIIRAFAGDLAANAKEGKPAYVLNVGSEHSLGVPPHVMPLSGYTISKQADLAITETVRRDLAATGVQVSLLAPGWVLTESVSAIMDKSEEFRAAVEPYVQPAADVARIALEGLSNGREIIVTNPKSVPFARARAEAVLRDLDAAERGRGQDHSGDISKCPVMGR
ncbi:MULTISPECIES: SDR family NAD(P)-dependent oxidoreductase [Nocardia]|uniref:SDR family NAD(P)-dependent oxidoreductase n=1 Tax=Nocardia abscessus TaxID=120957 RepID=UPI0018934CAF|nr:SDR family oxidoreductase [Nocardia abscessus]MBF6472628.1 SDR family oxidoreductase [Nocardia abscessus]